GQPFDAQDLARIEVERLAPGFRVYADDRMKDRLPITVLGVEQSGRFPATTIRKGTESPFEPLLQLRRQGVVGGVHAREERVAAATGNRERVQLGGFEGHDVIRAIGVPAFGAASV